MQLIKLSLTSLLIAPSVKSSQETPETKSSDITSENQTTKDGSIHIKKVKIYEPDRIKEIGEILESSTVGIIPPITELIGDYEYHDKTIYEFFNRPVDDLKIPEQDRYSLDLYSNDFMSWFLGELQKKQKEFPYHHQFWYDLYRFMFKWILVMRRVFADTDALFESSIISAKSIMTILYKDGFKFRGYINDKFSPDRPFDFSIFGGLMRHESFDNPQLFKYFITKVIPDLYDDTGKILKDITLEQLKEKHFDKKSLNTKPLLKLMIFRFVPSHLVNQVKERFFPGEILDSQYFDYDFVPPMLKLYSGEYKCNNDYSIELFNEDYVSLETIEFLRSNSLGVRIHNHFHLIDFLKRLDRLNLLFEKAIPKKELIKFRLANDDWGWSADIYGKYLQESRDRNRISQAEHGTYLNII
jgi:hypothetical protein